MAHRPPPPATGPPDLPWPAAGPPGVPSPGAGPPERPCATGPPEEPSPPWLPTFGAVFREQYGYVLTFLRNLGLRERDVEDVAQEVFVQVFRRFHLYDRSRPPRPWLCAFAVHCARAHKRRSNGLDQSLDDAPEARERGSPLDDTVAARRSVRRGLAALSDEQREVFVLHELLGFTMPEVAEIVGILLNTAYSRLRLARTHFMDAVKPAEEASHD